MTHSICLRMFLVLLGMLVGSCIGDSSAEPSPCPTGGLQLPIVIVGDTFGTGLFALDYSTGEKLAARIVLYKDPSGEQVMLQLHAPATCNAGVIRARFGAGDSAVSPARIVGDSFEGLYQPKLFETELFGAWQVDMVDKKSGKSATLRGYLEHRDPAAATRSMTSAKPPLAAGDGGVTTDQTSGY